MQKCLFATAENTARQFSKSKMIICSPNMVVSVVGVFVGLGLFLQKPGMKSYTFIHYLLLLTKLEKVNHSSSEKSSYSLCAKEKC